MKCNQSRPWFELLSTCSFTTTITITPRAQFIQFIFYYHNSLRVFHTNFHWGLSDSKSPQHSRTLLSIQVVLNNAVVLDDFCSSNDFQFIQTICIIPKIQKVVCPVGWDCRIHRLLLSRGVRPPHNECPWYDCKQSDGEVQAMLELWEMESTPSLPLLPGPLWPGVVAPDRALSMG